jgi:hypothetical protein
MLVNSPKCNKSKSFKKMKKLSFDKCIKYNDQGL